MEFRERKKHFIEISIAEIAYLNKKKNHRNLTFFVKKCFSKN